RPQRPAHCHRHRQSGCACKCTIIAYRTAMVFSFVTVTPKRGGSRGVPRVKLPCWPAIASSDPLHGNGEYISDAALRLDDARRARIALELTPQAENLHIDAAVEDIFVNAGRLQQVLAAKRTLWRFEKGQQH